ncbi:RNA polymerase, sigma-24 subunit, ECF subfamily [Kribbella flavida DSM 17836]|uniref:RNA polymerase, sigma-24 subunit, ECF subfamily n=1 Tax=Kribbella flavida (strain DSM 17836 / JCM 10339 / NBRC 14399) TaxID=479435 RepID=D2PM83_KRIFD|nr:RNA polymerase sigma factor SigJ [Kribbella flavida]ADB34451.1 RNA polymerase, sigma-24 subunit, ECF subfamily [Kribbella flavida DSM 17836]
MNSDELAAEFAEHRAVLVGAAYRVVGSVADAEDVVQETWLRWSTAEHAEVRDVRAYLVRITTRLALNRLRQQKSRREQYVGPWLPEPIAAADQDPAAVAEVADSVSMAMLVVLETLSPLERAAFVLREVFDLPFSEIADTLGRSEAAVRQLAHRAREHVHARQPRHRVDKARHQEITSRFLTATWSGDYDQVVAMLAPDVELVSDGGGKRRAALRPVHGSDKVGRWLIAVMSPEQTAGLEFGSAMLNGEQAFVAYDGPAVDTVGFMDLDENGLISRIYVVRNPDKLKAVPGREQRG